MSNRANDQGRLAEDQVDISLRAYRARRLACGVATYPEVTYFRAIGKKGSFEGRYTGKGAPDRAVALRQIWGRLCWLEIKTWEAKNKHTLRRRIHQYHQMKDAIDAGGALGFYLVKWRWEMLAEWRLYPVGLLAENNEGGIVFVREAGKPVDNSQGFPDWLPVAIESAAGGS